MKYKAIVFDLDGTLLDTLDDIAASMNHVLRARGFPTHTKEAYRYFVGSGAATLVSRTLPHEKRNDELTADCVKAFRKEYKNNWKVKTGPYSGVPELLDALVKSHIKMTVLSNKPHDFTKSCARKFFSRWEFSTILGQRDGIPMKPDPTAALEIARGLKISPREFLYLGDTGIDMKTAIGAGMFPVGALWGFRTEEELREHGAIEIIDRPIELLKFVK